MNNGISKIIVSVRTCNFFCWHPNIRTRSVCSVCGRMCLLARKGMFGYSRSCRSINVLLLSLEFRSHSIEITKMPLILSGVKQCENVFLLSIHSGKGRKLCLRIFVRFCENKRIIKWVIQRHISVYGAHYLVQQFSEVSIYKNIL